MPRSCVGFLQLDQAEECVEKLTVRAQKLRCGRRNGEYLVDICSREVTCRSNEYFDTFGSCVYGVDMDGVEWCFVNEVKSRSGSGPDLTVF